jgi:hypothetical protein
VLCTRAMLLLMIVFLLPLLLPLQVFLLFANDDAYIDVVAAALPPLAVSGVADAGAAVVEVAGGMVAVEAGAATALWQQPR